jgi:hypothetical protein
MLSTWRVTSVIAVLLVGSGRVGHAHEISGPAPISQPTSPVQLESCYLGTNFMFGDPRLKSEETKMQLSAGLAKPAPSQYRMLGLRFEFGVKAGKHDSDVVVFTGSDASSRNIMDTAPPGLRPSGYLPRVPNYDDARCGVDFTTSLDWKNSWFDAASDVVACTVPMPVTGSERVWLTALELRQTSSDAVFLMARADDGVYWSVDGSAPQLTKPDGFGRAVVPLGQLGQSAHTLTFGATATKLDQQVCFRPFSAAR